MLLETVFLTETGGESFNSGVLTGGVKRGTSSVYSSKNGLVEVTFGEETTAGCWKE